MQKYPLAVALLLITIAFAAAAVAAGDAPSREAAITQLDFRKVIQDSKQRVFPAVIFVKCVRQSHETGKRLAGEVSGSGVAITADGQVLTNWHVVDKATQVRCLLFDGRAYDAKVLGSDKDLDIPLLKLDLKDDKKPIPCAELGDSCKLVEGDFVMAMGAPWGLNRSVSMGIISCTRRYLEDDSEYNLWLQTDASISPGNSGGPLINTEGKIIGINARAMIEGGTVGFAIPSVAVSDVLPRLREFGRARWAYTGLRLQPLHDFNRNVYFDGDSGVIVAGADPDSPAKKAGIQQQDRILSVNGRTLTAMTEEDLPDLRRSLSLLSTTEPAKFELMRGGKRMTVELTPRDKGDVEGAELDCPRWDLTVKQINQFDTPDLYFYRKQGVFIFGVKDRGNGADAGLINKDIVMEVDGQKIATIDDLKKVHKLSLDGAASKSRILIKVMRGGLLRQVILDLSRDYERE